MATLPPDFWDKPQPGGMTGLIIGGIIGAGLALYLFRGGDLFSWQGFVTMLFGSIGMMIGMLIGMFVAFYLGN
jgi:phosphate/sulfate permease